MFQYLLYRKLMMKLYLDSKKNLLFKMKKQKISLFNHNSECFEKIKFFYSEKKLFVPLSDSEHQRNYNIKKEINTML